MIEILKLFLGGIFHGDKKSEVKPVYRILNDGSI